MQGILAPIGRQSFRSSLAGRQSVCANTRCMHETKKDLFVLCCSQCAVGRFVVVLGRHRQGIMCTLCILYLCMPDRQPLSPVPRASKNIDPAHVLTPY